MNNFHKPKIQATDDRSFDKELYINDTDDRSFDKGLYVNDDDQDWGSAGMNNIQEDSE